MSPPCTKQVLHRHEGPHLFYEQSETQVEATALWSVCLGMYLHIYDFSLFSLLSESDILYSSFKGILQTFCLLLSEVAFSFF